MSEVPTGSRRWAIVRKVTLCYFGAAFASVVALAIVHPPPGGHLASPGEALALMFLTFPLLPFVFLPSSLIAIVFEPSKCIGNLQDCALPLVAFSATFVAVFAGLWKLFPVRLSSKKARESSYDHSRKNIEQGSMVASDHLIDPVYVVDYARSRGLDLNGVHALIKSGELSSYWHKGILFVGQKKVEAPNPALQGTHGEAGRL